MIHIGIDPGTHTGLAVWDSGQERFLLLETLPIHKALDLVCKWQQDCKDRDVAMDVTFEDARQRTWFGKGNVSAKMQGAGIGQEGLLHLGGFLQGLWHPILGKASGQGNDQGDTGLFQDDLQVDRQDIKSFQGCSHVGDW